MKIVRVSRSHLDGYPELDVLGSYVGPCLVCGGPDKRHRLADSIVENVRAGDSERFVAENYDVPLRVVRTLVRTWTL